MDLKGTCQLNTSIWATGGSYKIRNGPNEKKNEKKTKNEIRNGSKRNKVQTAPNDFILKLFKNHLQQTIVIKSR